MAKTFPSYRTTLQARLKVRQQLAASRRRAIENGETFNAAFDNAERNSKLNELFARATHATGTMSPSERRTLVDRSRYEILEANGHYKGIGRAAISLVLGRGAFVEVKQEGMPTTDARMIEQKFNAWFKLVNGARKLRVMGWAKITDGSGLAMITNNPKLAKRGDGITLDFVPFEDEQIQRPLMFNDKPSEWNRNYLLDGKEFDDFGNPERYWVTQNHPIDDPTATATPVDAEYVIDVWSWERPSQGRGNPEMGTVVGDGPMMRIYEQAVVDCAATAAKHSAIFKTNTAVFTDGEAVYDPIGGFVEVPLNTGVGTFLPDGHDVTQLKAEQPTATYSDFMRTKVVAAGRPIGQPPQISTGDAAGINYAGGQLSRQDYSADVDVQHQDWEMLALSKLFRHWLEEAALAGVIPRKYRDSDQVNHEWRWTRQTHQDPQKEYTGRSIAVKTGLTSVAYWQEADGVDPEEEDLSAARSLGLSIEKFREARFRTLMPAAALALLGPGLTPNVGNTGSPEKQVTPGDVQSHGK